MRLRTSFILSATVLLTGSVVGTSTACYPAAGEGVNPPALAFYFPVGFAVSNGGSVLYVANSDFDLQWNGGTIQSLDLHLIRRDAVACIKDPTDPNLPLAQPPDPSTSCPNGPPVSTTRFDGGVVPGWACAPPTNASFYMRDSVAVGAFATDIQLSKIPHPTTGLYRLFTPVRGDASVTFVDVVNDDPTTAPLPTDTPATYAPFALSCNKDAHDRCSADNRVGNNAGQHGDSRFITMPGEPFGMAQSDDGQSIVVTHQNDVESSLFTTFTPFTPNPAYPPALQFVLSGVPTGGIGIASIPHDYDAYADCDGGHDTPACQAIFPRPAFLQTSRAAAQVALIRYYNDQGDPTVSVFRPFLQNEADYNLVVNAGTTDFARGIAIDPTPSIRCKAIVEATVATTDPTYGAQIRACAQKSSRVFVASRGPASLVIGTVGGQFTQGGAYDADLAVFTKSIPLPNGPSAVRMAPIIDHEGNYAMRVFIVCFDANAIIDYDPDEDRIEAVIPVGLGPFALAFDPFDYTQAALGAHVDVDPRDGDISLKKYRFAYVGSFTQSYLQVIDLDNSTADKSTWAAVAYTVGVPTPPKGT